MLAAHNDAFLQAEEIKSAAPTFISISQNSNWTGYGGGAWLQRLDATIKVTGLSTITFDSSVSVSGANSNTGNTYSVNGKDIIYVEKSFYHPASDGHVGQSFSILSYTTE